MSGGLASYEILRAGQTAIGKILNGVERSLDFKMMSFKMVIRLMMTILMIFQLSSLTKTHADSDGSLTHKMTSLYVTTTVDKKFTSPLEADRHGTINSLKE